jgi:hypothetical protein
MLGRPRALPAQIPGSLFSFLCAGVRSAQAYLVATLPDRLNGEREVFWLTWVRRLPNCRYNSRVHSLEPRGDTSTQRDLRRAVRQKGRELAALPMMGLTVAAATSAEAALYTHRDRTGNSAEP